MNCCDRKTEMKTLHLILRDGSDRTIGHVVPVKMSPLTTSWLDLFESSCQSDIQKSKWPL